MDNWLIMALVAVINTGAVLALTYYFLFHKYRQAYLLTWGGAWTCHVLRNIAILTNILTGGKSTVLLICEQYFILCSSYLLLYGSLQFVSKKLPRLFKAGIAVIALWVFIAAYTDVSKQIYYMPTYFLLAATTCYAGLVLWRLKDPIRLHGNKVAGTALLVWGCHQFDYPFLRHVTWAAPWGFQLGATLALIVAVGMTMLFFERLHAQQSEAENKIRGVLQTAMDGYVLLSGDGKLLDTNDAYCLMSGYNRQELLSMAISDIEAHETPEETARHMAYTQTKGTDRFLTRHRRKDGSSYDVEVSVQLLPATPIQFAAFYRDITETKRSADALRAKDTLLSALLQGTTDAIYVKDIDGRYLLANHAVEDFVGIPVDQVIGHDDTLLFSAEEAREIMERDRKIMESGVTGRYEEIVTLATGELAIFQSIKGPIRDSKEQITGLFGIARDVTATTKAEKSLLQTEAMLRAMLENFPLDFWARDLSGQLIVQSDISKVVWNDLKQDPENTNIPAQTLSRWQANNALAMQGSTVHDEAEYLLPNGSSAILQEILAPIRDGKDILGIMGVNVDITNTRRMERDLRASVDAAQAASQAKNLFLANMSHEIRTPLNGILGMLQLLQITAVDSEQQEYVEQALKSSRRLSGLLSDILDHSRIEAGKLSIQDERFKLSSLQESVTELFTLAAREKGIALKFTLDKRLPETIFGDETRIRQILFNLVGNAIKFTHKGAVQVHIQPLNKRADKKIWILFSVCDTGIGISDDHVQSVFQPFIQAENSYTRQYQGAGLGLSIVGKLLNLMGGTLVIDSAEGEGSSLYFSIPMAVPSEEQLADNLESNKNIPAPNTPKLRILLAEDDMVNRISLSKLLEKMGHTVSAVVNGEEAAWLVSEKDFDLIFMDVQMPVLDGVQATQAIRKSMVQGGKTPIPIIAMTAFAMTGDREKFLAAGMDDYVAKPVAMEELHAILTRVGKNLARS